MASIQGAGENVRLSYWDGKPIKGGERFVNSDEKKGWKLGTFFDRDGKPSYRKRSEQKNLMKGIQ